MSGKPTHRISYKNLELLGNEFDNKIKKLWVILLGENIDRCIIATNIQELEPQLITRLVQNTVLTQ